MLVEALLMASAEWSCKEAILRAWRERAWVLTVRAKNRLTTAFAQVLPHSLIPSCAIYTMLSSIFFSSLPFCDLFYLME